MWSMPSPPSRLRILRSKPGISFFAAQDRLMIVGLVVTPSMGWPGIIARNASRSAESKRINIASPPLDQLRTLRQILPDYLYHAIAVVIRGNKPGRFLHLGRRIGHGKAIGGLLKEFQIVIVVAEDHGLFRTDAKPFLDHG